MEELWDLEEAWLAGKEPSVAGRMTRSVAGTFFDMYCGVERLGAGGEWVEVKGVVELGYITDQYNFHLCALLLSGAL